MGSDGLFSTRVDTRNDVALLTLIGELDMQTVPDLNERLDSLRSDGLRAIVLDLREVTFIDSSGLRAFIQAKMHAEQDGHRVMLIGAGPFARRLFELTRTESLLDDAAAAHYLDLFTAQTDGAESDRRVDV